MINCLIYLNIIFIFWQGSEIDSRYNPNRPLPKDNYCREEFEYGFYEPDVNEVPEGKVTLRQAVTFIDKYMKDPTNYTADVIANEYKIDPKVTGKYTISLV